MLRDGRLESVPTLTNNFKKIKVGMKTLDDAILDLGSVKEYAPKREFGQKATFYRAVSENDYVTLRVLSQYFYKTSGIYRRMCDYFATLYRYDWYVTAQVNDFDNTDSKKVFKDFMKILDFLDASYIKKLCGDIALAVIRDGCYYGYLVPSKESVVLQQLPSNYCRSRYFVKNMPAIEFNMAYFDTFANTEYRMKVLNLFPDEFKQGYLLYKKGKLRGEDYGDSYGWFLLSPGSTIKFNFNNMDIPLFANVIPYILDLDVAQDLDRRKTMQKLLKILVQKLPMDKNGELIFDVDEARDIHNNAVAMLKRAVGVDVVTTFADVESIDLADSNTATSTDDLEKIERTVFNASGISHNLFNTDGNIALQMSILNDESNVRNLLLQFEIFFNNIVKQLAQNRKKYTFKFSMLETTQYNYQALAKLYKEQAQLGYSKMLPQIALGRPQSFILNSAYFENEVLHLAELMLPNLMSSTMNLEDLMGRREQNNQSKTSEDNTGGRPEKDDAEKSEKTIQNKESMS